METPRDRASKESIQLEVTTTSIRSELLRDILAEFGLNPRPNTLITIDDILIGYVNVAIADYLQQYSDYSFSEADMETIYLGFYAFAGRFFARWFSRNMEA